MTDGDDDDDDAGHGVAEVIFVTNARRLLNGLPACRPLWLQCNIANLAMAASPGRLDDCLRAALRGGMDIDKWSEMRSSKRTPRTVGMRKFSPTRSILTDTKLQSAKTKSTIK